MTTSRRWALVRVSTDRQAVDRQIDVVREAGVDDAHVVVEHGVSGDAETRDGLAELLRVTRSGDEVIVAELSRLGRRTSQVLQLVETLTEAGVSVRCLNPALTFDGSPVSRLLLALLAAVAEMELAVIRERTREGLAAARARGRVGGRPARLSDAQRRTLTQLHAEGKPARELAEIFGVSLRTVYRAVEADERLKGSGGKR